MLGDGDFPTSPQALAMLEHADFLCCCDNAGKSLIERLTSENNGKDKTNYRFPDAIVGDGDSLPWEFKEKYADIYHEVDEQDYNDLTKATRFCIEQGFKEIHYLGCTGKREDHTLGNISLMAFYMRDFNIRPIMLTDYVTVSPASGTTTFKSFPRQQISIFNLNCNSISSDGLKWNAYPYRELWQGTLNEALSYSFTISADGDYLVMQTHLPK